MSKKENNKKGKLPEFEDTKSPDYKYIFATDVFGGLDPNEGRLIFFLDRVEPETNTERGVNIRIKKIIRELQVEVHVSPAVFKNISIWMSRHVKQYENVFGEIARAPKKKELENKKPPKISSEK